MRFHADPALMFNIVRDLGRFAQKRTTLPVLSMLLLKPVAGMVHAFVTDLDTIALGKIVASPDLEPGPGVCVPLKPLRLILQKLRKAGTVTVEKVSDTALAIRFGSTTYTLEGLHQDEFPSIPEHFASAPSGVRMDQGTALDVFSHFPVFTSREESRPILQNVYFEAEDGRLLATATDGIYLLHDAFDVEGEMSGLVPFRFMEKAAHLIKRCGAEGVDVWFPETGGHPFVMVRVGPFTLSTRACDEVFPGWRQVVPKGTTVASAELDPSALSKALEDVAVILSGQHHSRTDWTLNGSLKVSAQSAERGNAETEVETVGLDTGGDVFRISFDADRMRSVLRAFSSNVGLTFTGPERSGVVSAGSRLGLLMPLRPQ